MEGDLVWLSFLELVPGIMIDESDLWEPIAELLLCDSHILSGVTECKEFVDTDIGITEFGIDLVDYCILIDCLGREVGEELFFFIFFGVILMDWVDLWILVCEGIEQLLEWGMRNGYSNFMQEEKYLLWCHFCELVFLEFLYGVEITMRGDGIDCIGVEQLKGVECCSKQILFERLDEWFVSYFGCVRY